jgi:hypothetical protein
MAAGLIRGKTVVFAKKQLNLLLNYDRQKETSSERLDRLSKPWYSNELCAKKLIQLVL